MDKIINKLYQNRLLGQIFHTTLYCLGHELKDCQTVLELGCGPNSILKFINFQHSVGVDAFEPYLKKAKKNATHHKLILKDITKLNFKPKSFDAVVMIEVLEHLEKMAGKKILQKAEQWAKKKVILTTPNGYLKQEGADNNPFQTHQSGWDVVEMTKLGYQAYGMAGFKFLSLRGKYLFRNKVQNNNFLTKTNKIRSFMADASQIVAYYFAKLAFRVFYIKNLKA